MPWLEPTESTIDGAKVLVSESDQRNRHGAMRYIVKVVGLGPVDHTEFVEQSRWLGHCWGQLLLPEIVARAKQQCAKGECPTPTLCNDFSACDARQIANDCSQETTAKAIP